MGHTTDPPNLCLSDMMMKTCIALLAIVAIATALPTEDFAGEDSVVPGVPPAILMQEDRSVKTVTYASGSAHVSAPREEAIKEINKQQAMGKDLDHCEDLANEMLEEVGSFYTEEQSMLNELYTGVDCHTEGMAAVTTAYNRYTVAQEKLTTAEKHLKIAENYQVDFGAYKFSSLSEGFCSSFYSEFSYVTAKATYKKRVEEVNTAKGYLVNTKTAWEQAKIAAAEAQRLCMCGVKTTHSKVWTISNSH